jgi:lipoprotein-anchoring transpeptidase ErfK/SrfK
LRKAFLPILFALGFLAAGGLSAGVVAATTTTATTGTEPTTTTTTTSTTPTQPPPTVIAQGVTIGGVGVGGLTPEAATTAVRAAFSRPLVLVARKVRFRPLPGRLGAVAYIEGAVARAKGAAPGTSVPLKVVVHGKKLRSYVRFLSRKVDRPAVDAAVTLRNLRPWISKDRPGQVLDAKRATRSIQRTLVANRRGTLRLKLARVPAQVRRATFGPVIVTRRASHELFLYQGMRVWRTFGVAVGQPAYPTPLGHFAIAVMWRNPWWYPPNSGWAAGSSPIPPGPGNPLGTRWMGLTAPGVGIHGTPDAASIGYSASHGCIRMRIPEAEWLFAHVSVGTQVFIVPA